MFNPDLAAVRFGTGLSPKRPAPRSVDTILSELTAPDRAAERFPIGGLSDQLPDILAYRALNRDKRDSDAARMAQRKLRRRQTQQQIQWLAHRMARWVDAPVGFQERLENFWADHFTVVGKSGLLRSYAATFSQDAIRPHLAGRFEDMLIAAIQHPLMLTYLDQTLSVGEDSKVAQKRGKGLNENLAREVLELHTLGVGGAYTQTDVREFAKLLAGFRFNAKGKVVYSRGRATPGAEVILGKSYGQERPDIRDVHQALRDFARHPDTARHIATKLATHFVSDTPDPDLIDHIRAAYAGSGGELLQTYRALLEHPAAWDQKMAKVKQPFDFIATATRALGIPAQAIAKQSRKDILSGVVRPMQMMGQTWERPNGPDGWPEEAAHWITPQGLAARVQWSMTVPTLALNSLPDPRDFVTQALGDLASPDTRFAAKAAETRWEGIGLVLASPEFQSR